MKKSQKWVKMAQKKALTHSKPMKEVGSKGVTMYFGSHFVTYFIIYIKIALNPPPCGSK